MLVSGAITYIFDGISFYRIVEPDSFSPWVHPELTYDVSPVLDGPVYVDNGGVVPAAFEIVAAFGTRAERVAMIEKIGMVGTLEKSGRSIDAMLVAVAVAGLGDLGLWQATLTFQAIAAWPWVP